MSEVVATPRGKVRAKMERPRLYKVILLNDDFTLRAFVVTVLKKGFRLSEEQAHRVMLTAHRRGACVVAVFVRDIAESRAAEATDPRLRGGRFSAAAPAIRCPSRRSRRNSAASAPTRRAHPFRSGSPG